MVTRKEIEGALDILEAMISEFETFGWGSDSTKIIVAYQQHFILNMVTDEMNGPQYGRFFELSNKLTAMLKGKM